MGKTSISMIRILREKVGKRTHQTEGAGNIEHKRVIGKYGFEWQTHTVFRLPKSDTPYITAEKMLHTWRAKLRKTHGRLWLAYAGVVSLKPIPHIHLLVVGVHTRNGRYYKLKGHAMEKHWPVEGTSTKQVYDQDGIISYIVDRNTQYGNYKFISPIKDQGVEKVAKRLELGLYEIPKAA